MLGAFYAFFDVEVVIWMGLWTVFGIRVTVLDVVVFVYVVLEITSI